MNAREAINVGLTKLGFKEIRENQRKVVEAYVGGRDVLMVAPTGSGKSLTFHIAPFVLDFYKHGERDLVDTVCLVIFPLVSLTLKNQDICKVSVSRFGGRRFLNHSLAADAENCPRVCLRTCRLACRINYRLVIALFNTLVCLVSLLLCSTQR